MTHTTQGWTGGQYSLIRILTGLGVIIQVMLLHPWPEATLFENGLLTVVLIAAIPFVLGWKRRIAAAVLALALPGPGMTPTVVLMGLHALVEAHPFGAWSARGRTDPAGSWSMSTLVIRAAQAGVLLGWSDLLLGPWLPVHIVPIDAGFIALHLLALPPSLLPPRKRISTVFYDGGCGLCHRSVRFLLAEDKLGTLFRFSPLEGQLFIDQLADASTQLPDSMVVQAEEGQLYLRGDAVRFLADRLGGWWRLLAGLMTLVPSPLRNLVYDGVAKMRYRLFGRADTSCPLLPPHLQERFQA